MQGKNEALITPRQFHKKFQREGGGSAIGLKAVYGLLETGRIRHVRVGRKYLVLASEVQDFPLRESGQPEQRAA